MKVESRIGLHNEFDIEVKDIKTGEIRLRGKAYNILLNNIYTRLCNRSSFFDNINFGRGTGVTDPTRTALFSEIASLAATTVEELRDVTNNIFYRKRKIILNPSSYVGETITEVGIYGGTLNSHALIKDSEGNPITITKSSTDEITIYATVYFQLFNYSNGAIEFSNLPNGNYLVNYLFGSSFTTPSIGVGCGMGINDEYVPSIISRIGSTVNTSYVADVANKKMTTNIVRFETTNGNGDIFEIDLVNVCRAKLPISGIWNGYNVVNEQIGIGDGITTDFDLPKNYAKDEGLSIKINGVSVLNYLKELYLSRIGYKLNYSFGGAANAFSPEGDYFASYTTYNANIPIYKRNGESFAVIATVNISGSSEVKGLALSPNAEYFAACDYNARIQVFKRSGNTFTKIVDNAPSINGNGYACAFSPDGIYLAIGDTSSPYLTIFKRTGDIFTKLPNPTTSPSGTVQHIAFSPDGIYLAVGHDYSPYVTIYKRDGDIFTKLPNPASLPSSYGSHVVFTQDGNYLGVSEWSGETFATVYSRNGDSFTKITSSKPLIFTGLSANSVALPLSIDYIASGNGIYNLTKNKTKIKFDTPPIAGDVISADYTIDYMPKDINHVIDVSFSIQFGEGA